MGYAHGGLIFTVLDFLTTSGAIASTKDHKISVSAEINVSYLQPVKAGEELYFLTECKKAGKRMAFSECWVYREAQEGEFELVCRGHQSHCILGQPFFDTPTGNEE